MATWSDRIRLGVIRDARGRHWRERRLVMVAVLVAVLAAVGVYALVASAGQPRYAVPPPGRATGSLHAVPPGSYAFWVTPDLTAGSVSLDLSAKFASASEYDDASCSCDGYPGADWSLGPERVVFPTPPQLARHTSYPNNFQLVTGNVAAIRAVHVGKHGAYVGTVGTVSLPGLPPGDKAAAFQAWPVGNPYVLEPLDANGTVLAKRGSDGVTNFQGEATTTHRGACAVSSTLTELNFQSPTSVAAIKAIPASWPGVFLSCLDDPLVFDGTRLQVAILLNAHHLHQQAAALWGSTAVPAHPDLVELRPPPRLRSDAGNGAPVFARRAGNAWLVVEGQPGLTPAPNTAQRIQVLESIRITRLDLRP
jgi:hypothetical protein